MLGEPYHGEKIDIAPEVSTAHNLSIIAVEKRRYGSDNYPTETFYKLIRVGRQFKIYTYVIDHDRELWAEREDKMPKRFTESQALEVWEEFKKHLKDGAEIGTGFNGPVFWEAILRRDGSINPNPDEDWKCGVGSTFTG